MLCKISIIMIKLALSCKIYQICKNMHIQILDLISWHRETNLFRTLLYLTIIKKSMQMLEVPKPSYKYVHIEHFVCTPPPSPIRHF
jgi:hypothetical protein